MHEARVRGRAQIEDTSPYFEKDVEVLMGRDEDGNALRRKTDMVFMFSPTELDLPSIGHKPIFHGSDGHEDSLYGRSQIGVTGLVESSAISAEDKATLRRLAIKGTKDKVTIQQLYHAVAYWYKRRLDEPDPRKDRTIDVVKVLGLRDLGCLGVNNCRSSKR